MRGSSNEGIRSRCMRRFVTVVLAPLVTAAIGCGRVELDDGRAERELVAGEQGVRCGVERWAVKVGLDDDVWSMNFNPLDTTLDALINFPRPGYLPPRNRLSEELQVYRLSDITMTVYKLETDSDYHLVIADGGETMIAEIPHPGCVGSDSPFLPGVQAARDAFDSRYVATGYFQTANVTATVLGAGFFDFLHGQRGVAPNGIELHAVLAICFDAGCDPGWAVDQVALR